MRFEPANIRVINRRASSSTDTGSAVPTRNAQSPPTGTCSRYAARRVLAPARTVLAGKVRFAAPKPGGPLPAALRSGLGPVATGGSDGNTSRPCVSNEKERTASLLRRKAGLTFGSNCQPGSGVDRSLHIRTVDQSLRDILNSILLIEEFIAGVSFDRFRDEPMRIAAVGHTVTDHLPRLNRRSLLHCRRMGSGPAYNAFGNGVEPARSREHAGSEAVWKYICPSSRKPT
jgi:hypothetical protein